MTSPSFHDMENLSAYLDGQLSLSDRMRLEKRIQSDAALAAALQELRQTRALLQCVHKRRAPHNFTLTPRMAGVRPPVPHLVPAFAWASALAMVLFIFTLGTSLVGRLSSESAAPMLAAAPSGLGGGPPAAATMAPVNPESATNAPAIAAPATNAPANPEAATIVPATVAPAPLRTTNQTELATPTVEAFLMSVPEATQPGTTGVTQPPFAPKALQKPINPWLLIWPGLAMLLGLLALLAQWLNQRAFQRKNPPG